MTACRFEKEVQTPSTLTLGKKIVELNRPQVMGILNITPDSFYSPSRAIGSEDAVRRVRTMLEQGADIIDIGAWSTRPGSAEGSHHEEMSRLEGPMAALREAFPDAIFSLDTFRASVAREALIRWNIDIINDVRGGEDPEMFEVVADFNAGYVLMHMRGTSVDMDSRCDYEDVTTDVIRELAFKISEARKAGICNLIVDPGFGFAKNTAQNLELLDNLEAFKVLQCPVLVGISRKRMVREACGCDLADSLAPTIALNTAALLKGASIIRVHDVEEGVLTVKTIEKLWKP